MKKGKRIIKKKKELSKRKEGQLIEVYWYWKKCIAMRFNPIPLWGSYFSLKIWLFQLHLYTTYKYKNSNIFLLQPSKVDRNLQRWVKKCFLGFKGYNLIIFSHFFPICVRKSFRESFFWISRKYLRKASTKDKNLKSANEY